MKHKLSRLFDKDLFIQNLAIIMFFGLGIAFLAGSFQKLTATDAGRYQLANLVGNENAQRIFAFTDKTQNGTIYKDTSRNKFAINSVDDGIVTGSLNNDFLAVGVDHFVQALDDMPPEHRERLTSFRHDEYYP